MAGRLLERSIIALLTLGLLVTVASGVAADAGRDEDAPGDWRDAWTMEPGSYNGSVYEHNEDWYRVEVPDGKALRFTYEPHESTWDEAVIRADDGPVLGEVDPGQTQRIGTTTGALRIGVAPFFDSFTYTLTFELVDAPTQDDAGSGTDAGNVWQHASPSISTGTVQGDILPGLRDAADFYRLPVPADHWVRVRSDEAGYLGPFLYETDGDRLDTDSSGSDEAWGAPSTDEALVGLQSDGRYQLTVETSPQPEVAVTDVTVIVENVTTDHGSVPTGTQRSVVVDLENRGEGPTVAGELRVWTQQDAGAGDNDRVVYDEPVAVDANEQRTIEIPWDGTGQIGDATVHARYTTLFDLDPANDHDQTRSYVLVGNIGTGVDAGNQRVEEGPSEVPVVEGHVHVEDNYDHDARYVHVHARTVVAWPAVAGTMAEVGLQDGEPHLAHCAAHAGCRSP